MIFSVSVYFVHKNKYIKIMLIRLDSNNIATNTFFLLLFAFLFHDQYFYHFDVNDQLLLQACGYENKVKFCILNHLIEFPYCLLQMLFY